MDSLGNMVNSSESTARHLADTHLIGEDVNNYENVASHKFSEESTFLKGSVDPFQEKVFLY